jgi:hypothetical protein
LRVIFPRDHGDFSSFFLGQKDCASTASRVALSRAAALLPRYGFVRYRFWRLSNRAKAARRAALGGGGSTAGESFYPWSLVVIFGKMFGNRWKTIPAPEKLFKKSRISS